MMMTLISATLLGCGAPAPPSGGLTEAEAVAAARQNASDATGVVSATVGPISAFGTGHQQVVPDDTWVWAVVVSGTFPFSCGPAPTPGESPRICPKPATTETVLLDYRTGAFILSYSHGE
jgi:hypothetical protein